MSNEIDPGKLDRRVALFFPTTVRDSMGGFTKSWDLSGYVWARFTPVTGREIQQAGQKLAAAAATFRIRYQSGITAAWRVVYDGIAYELTAPPVEIDRRYMLDLVGQALTPSTMGVAGMQVFTVDLDDGAETQVIPFPTAFATAPRAVYVTLVAPVGQPSFTFAIRAASILTTDFTLDFGAEVPGTGYKVSIIAVK